MYTLKDKLQLIANSTSFEEVRNAGILPEPDFDDGFYFVSYSHLDYKQVLTDIVKLREQNIKIWYDRGLETGISWLEDVCRKIDSYYCKGVLIYSSDNFLRSESCEKELCQAIKSKKSCLVIKLNNINFEERFFPYAELSFETSCEEKIKHILALPKPDLFNFEVVPRRKFLGVCAVLTAVNDKNIKKAVIPQWAYINNKKYPVRIIGAHAFSYCENLTEVVLQDGWFMILDEAFANCRSLNHMVFGTPYRIRGTFSIGVVKEAFTNCSSIESLNSFEYKGKKLAVGKINFISAFKNCASLRKVDIGKEFMFEGACFESCTKIEFVRFKGKQGSGESMFAHNSFLKYVEYGRNCLSREIHRATYAHCTELENVMLSKHIKIIRPYAFFHCDKLKKIKLPKRTTTIGDNAFAYSGLEELYIHKHMAIVFITAFHETKALKTVIINSRKIKFLQEKQYDDTIYNEPFLLDEIFPYADYFYLKKRIHYSISEAFENVQSDRKGYCKYQRKF